MRNLAQVALVSALTAMVAPVASAAVYYVDAVKGSDEATGTAPAAAWRSLASIASHRFAAGDYILLHRGQTWTETATWTLTGQPDLPITVGAFGEGPLPVIEGRGGIAADLLGLRSSEHVVLSNLELRNATGNGLNIYQTNDLILRGLVISGSARDGALIYDSNQVIIESCEIFGNALDLSQSYDGLRIDGGSSIRDITVRNSRIHDNLGGKDWNSANGVFVGHTGSPQPTVSNVTVFGNELYNNGNPNQNQAGRGLTGTFHGDIRVEANYIHHNASAGLYLGDHGYTLTIAIRNNTFYNNALRQFGGFTERSAEATGNAIFVDDPELTAMGVEIGGTGAWTLRRNSFFYMTPTRDRFRGFVRLNDAATGNALKSDSNLFYSPSTLYWKRPDGSSIDFKSWQAAGFDANSRNPK